MRKTYTFHVTIEGHDSADDARTALQAALFASAGLDWAVIPLSEITTKDYPAYHIDDPRSHG